jgi:hypothetical protein
MKLKKPDSDVIRDWEGSPIVFKANAPVGLNLGKCW